MSEAPNLPKALVQRTVDQVTARAQEQGMDLSPKDVGWIVSNFIEAVFTGAPWPAQFSAGMQAVADHAAAVRDE